MTTEKDLHRGIPVQPEKDQLAEAFHRAIDTLGDGPLTGLPAKIQKQNEQKARALLKSVRAKRR